VGSDREGEKEKEKEQECSLNSEANKEGDGLKKSALRASERKRSSEGDAKIQKKLRFADTAMHLNPLVNIVIPDF
jgi:hypothetical protein